MVEKLNILNGLKLGEFIQINEMNFKSENGDAVIVNRTELESLLKDRMKEEIPYLDNKILKKYLPEKFQSDTILDDQKELCKYDPSMLFNLISEPDLFFLELITPPDELEVSELILSNSQFVYGDDQYMIFYSEIEN